MSNDYLEKYYIHHHTSSDINEHLPTFYKYTKECESVVECGVRSVVSTWGFVRGLIENGKQVKKLVGVDLNRSPNIDTVERICQLNGVDYTFVEGNDILVDLEPADIFFIDTWHIYGHLKRELERFAPLARKYIMMHDTVVDAIHGETIRNGWNAQQQSQESGYPVEEILRGLKPAIDEFLVAHPEFKVKEVFTNNNGLTILERI